jgi:hypothetical protein
MERICLWIGVAILWLAPAAFGLGFSDEAQLPHRGTMGVPFTFELTARGGYMPYHYKQGPGQLPPGLTMSSNGLIAGVPTKTGTYKFWAHVIDHEGRQSEREITINIEEPNGDLPALLNSWVKPGWNLTFDDEFDGKELNLNHFVPRFDNHPLLPNYCVVENGVAKLRMDKDKPTTRPDGLPGRVSALETREAHNSFAQKYGLFEIRARFPVGSGLCAGFWLIPIDKKYNQITADGGTRQSADEPTAIDVSEFLGKDAHADNFTVHFGRDMNDDGSEYQHTTLSEDLTKEFHVYALEWKPDELIWYMDGKEVHRSDKSPQSPFFVRLALFEGGTEDLNDRPWCGVWRGPIDTKNYPKDFEIDYVRAYSKAEKE